MKTHSILIVILFNIGLMYSQELIHFPSGDGLEITADFYPADSKDYIVLFHQAMYSRGAYLETAPKFNALGYNCLAVDLRSGGPVNDTPNMTCKAAKAKGLSTKYIDAYQDIIASISYVKETYNPEKLIILGSSYSSSLVLKYGAEHPDVIQGILSFSPGEYFGPEDFISATTDKIMAPVFITSKAKEHQRWKKIYDAIPAGNKSFYLPKNGGHHGAKALWERFDASTSYWKAVKSFLKNIT